MSRPPEAIWEKNAPSQIVLNSIFAALDGALIVIVLQDREATSGSHLLSLFLLVVSFFFFAVSAEKTVVALDERDIKKYAYYLLPYNLGVICGGVAVELITYLRFGNTVHVRLVPCFGVYSSWISGLLWLGTPVIFMWIWIHDAYWLVSCKQHDFDAWLEELEDKRSTKPDHTPLMKLFYWVRGLHD
jgi:hypothetical protein